MCTLTCAERFTLITHISTSLPSTPPQPPSPPPGPPSLLSSSFSPQTFLHSTPPSFSSSSFSPQPSSLPPLLPFHLPPSPLNLPPFHLSFPFIFILLPSTFLPSTPSSLSFSSPYRDLQYTNRRNSGFQWRLSLTFSVPSSPAYPPFPTSPLILLRPSLPLPFFPSSLTPFSTLTSTSFIHF